MGRTLYSLRTLIIDSSDSGADVAQYNGGGDTSLRLGGMALIIGLVLLLGGGCASMDAESPRCGGERMKPGDACVGSGSYAGYEDKKDEAGQAAYWLLRLGGVLALVGATAMAAGPIADKVQTRRHRARSTSRAQRPSTRPTSPPAAALTAQEIMALIDGVAPPAPNPAPAAPRRAMASPPPEPASRDQLAQEINDVRFPIVHLEAGYDQNDVDALLARVRRTLEGRGANIGLPLIQAATFRTAGHRQPGYDRRAVDAFLKSLESSLGNSQPRR
ncbi:predicted protein [Streptomyces sp. C]|nr:predicted protein [Streptomyces sp. C]